MIPPNLHLYTVHIFSTVATMYAFTSILDSTKNT